MHIIHGLVYQLCGQVLIVVPNFYIDFLSIMSCCSLNHPPAQNIQAVNRKNTEAILIVKFTGKISASWACPLLRLISSVRGFSFKYFSRFFGYHLRAGNARTWLLKDFVTAKGFC
jgi:hypothetical protein